MARRKRSELVGRTHSRSWLRNTNVTIEGPTADVLLNLFAFTEGGAEGRQRLMRRIEEKHSELCRAEAEPG
ncbi:hypothetical protein SKUL_37 [Pseudomonas phage Skulduggery]|uniref:Uncharacterized protein n=1 Tax=Pseudomonas phage Skulduggery TaxID=2006671 RepID=A0A1Y0SZN1_9CAUD|nr:hypothetical protein PP627_gp37 [Pseudomonas phage Skulduggery]ARV77136.1 hypothetical protein SKUL_37 [Pseudomonas phage Skulduggery]